jgi:hypothetical protein
MTLTNGVAMLVVLVIVAGIVWLVRSRCLPLRIVGWALAGFVALCVALIVLTGGSPGPVFDPEPFRPHQDKFPDGGLELAVLPPPLRLEPSDIGVVKRRHRRA